MNLALLIATAALQEGLSVSSYIAAAAVERASTDLGRGKEDSLEARERPPHRHMDGA